MGEIFTLPEGRPMQTYLQRHHEALQRPRGVEEPIAQMRSALLNYGLQYAVRYSDDAALGKDSVLGDCWLQIARGYLGLLNGETGRLDCGTLDGELRRWAERFGFEQEL